MCEAPFIITFSGSSTAEANCYAADLATAVRELDRELQVEQQHARQGTQDLGTTLAIIVGSASVTALAKGIAGWLARNAGAKIEIKADGSVIASNLDSRDAARIADAFSRRK